jgi:predicted RND superfamily exporter protein
MVLVSATDGDLLTRERLNAVHALAGRLKQMPETREVTSYTDRLVPAPRGFGVVPAPIPLVAAVPEGDVPAAWRDQLLAVSGAVPLLLSEDGRRGALLVDLDVDIDDLFALAPVMSAVEARARSAELPDGVEVSLTGLPVLNTGVLSAVVDDQMALVPLAGISVMVLLWLVFGTPRGVWIPAIAAALPLLLLLGVMGWLGEPVGALNQTFTVLVPVIAAADAIHLLHRFEEERRVARGQDDARRVAIRRTFDAMGVACFFTSVTTLAGFWSLGAANMPVLRHYGIFAGLGVALSFLVVLWVMPLALFVNTEALLPSRPERTSRLDDALTRLARGVTVRPWRVLGGALAISVVVWFGARQVHADFALSNLLGPEAPISRTAAVVDRELAGVLALEVGLTGAVDQVAALEAMDRFADRARRETGVRAVRSPAELVSTVRRVTVGRDGVPTTQKGLTRLRDRAPERWREDVWRDGSARMVLHVADEGADAFGTLETQLASLVEEELVTAGLSAHLTGTHLAAYRGFRGVSRDLRNSVAWAFASIGLLVALLFRSVRLGLLAVVPNALPLWVGVGFMGWMDWPLDQFTGVTLTIGLGLCVDNTIHLLARLREERRAGHPPDEAIVRAVRHAGSALTLTTWVLGAGFGLQVLSAFPGNRILGLLGALILVVAWVSNLVLVPALVSVGLLSAGGQPVVFESKESTYGTRPT